MIPTQREIDQIAEYADASVRGATRKGSLAPIRGRHGVNAWLYGKWGNRGNAIYTFTGGLLTIALSGAVASLVEEPLVFPSLDRKSTRLNSSHTVISYAVFCLKKKKKKYIFIYYQKKNKKRVKNKI